ncbi:hypothetical protein J2S43_003699 [Catenuloplanes nepalensis]|uniref:DUF1905 domain-containing protein n=1 Tax=Catenuloplanes nepalensis TaxID=587533 RepID=A0ABT9MUQ5_9ACTN|nr:DUF1905 domain-containing protein [Catenuloplanes nepalensis]MDP9795187.1 hypothetical protein [Catenuloplanes nepalensis]
MIVEFEAPLWEWDARQESWTFVSLPEDASEDIRHLTDGLRRGFGAVKVRAVIGRSEWSTSIFPDSKRGAYVLPVKRAVREKNGLATGDVTAVTVEILTP